MSSSEGKKKRLKLVQAGDEVPKPLPSSSPRVVKVNLPENARTFRSGNGEGCWAYIRKPEDVAAYDAGEGEFEVILLNDSFYYPALKWGTVIRVEGRGDEKRPVLLYSWMVSLKKGDISGLKEALLKRSSKCSSCGKEMGS